MRHGNIGLCEGLNIFLKKKTQNKMRGFILCIFQGCLHHGTGSSPSDVEEAEVVVIKKKKKQNQLLKIEFEL